MIEAWLKVWLINQQFFIWWSLKNEGYGISMMPYHDQPISTVSPNLPESRADLSVHHQPQEEQHLQSEDNKWEI